MLQLLRLLLPQQLLAPVIKPLTRLIIGLLAVPMFRILMRRFVRVQDLDEELEHDLELWFRGAILLLIASANMEQAFFGWVPVDLREEKGWMILAGRLMLAIGVIEGMPDQALFAIIHPGRAPFKLDRKHVVKSCINHIPVFLKAFVCQHLNRSSPVLAILTVIQGGVVGWVCYGMAITQYLIIGLVTSRDRALDVLQQFDLAISERRQELLEEIVEHHPPIPPPAPISAPANANISDHEPESSAADSSGLSMKRAVADASGS